MRLAQCAFWSSWVTTEIDLALLKPMGLGPDIWSPNDPIQASSFCSTPDTISYFFLPLNSSWRNLMLLSILSLFMQPSSLVLSTLLAGSKRRWWELKLWKRQSFTVFLLFQLSEIETTFSGWPFECNVTDLFASGEPMSSWLLVPMPRAISTNQEWARWNVTYTYFCVC